MPKRLPCWDKCHPGVCRDRELSPSVVRTCPCGKKNLADLREGMSGPVSTWQQMCRKLVTCKKHPCRSPCHNVQCPACGVVVNQKCRCGASSRRSAACYLRRAESKDDTSGSAVEGNDGGYFFVQLNLRICGRHRYNDR